MSFTVQYIILGIIFLVIAIWLWRKIRCSRRRKNSGCFGCALSETCAKKELKNGAKHSDHQGE